MVEKAAMLTSNSERIKTNPRISVMFVTQEPMVSPKLRWGWPSLKAVKQTESSGRVVLKATMLAPITDWEIPVISEITEAELTTNIAL